MFPQLRVDADIDLPAEFPNEFHPPELPPKFRAPRLRDSEFRKSEVRNPEVADIDCQFPERLKLREDEEYPELREPA